ncbi:allene oxide synthase-lipoxygenase protein-like isoform X2 [Lineus longissimus]|uniref:allene oxide synthase-lipoxygenase protein-like isoform X2 n=1 Tax=Lineus longissimus TaxID=88925 RepID=UPI002B4DF5CE
MGKAKSIFSHPQTDAAIPSYTIRVKTGDRKDAGTDANVKIRLYDENGQQTKDINLDVSFRDDFEEGNLDEFHVEDEAPLRTKIDKIALSRDNAGDWLKSADWYVEYVEVEVDKTKKAFIFPFHRWIHSDRQYLVQQYDVVLPQNDPHKEQRNFELANKKELYEYDEKVQGIPVQVKTVPPDETFSHDYKWDIICNKVKMTLGVAYKKFVTALQPFETLDDLDDLFKQEGWPWGIQVPKCVEHWKEDKWFGAQRLAGCNPVLIKLCKDIPNNFGVTPDMVAPFLEGLTLTQAMEKRRIYIVDLKILDNMTCKEHYELCSPLALFFVADDKSLLPIAIQLNQVKGPDNPVFLPSDDEYLWLMAKMWFNLGDATYHQSLTHLGFTHLKMESVSVCTHRNLSPSHPVFKLLAPHFLFLIAIDARGLALLVAPGGHVDHTMSCGCPGMFELIRKGASLWRMDTDADLVNDLKIRGVDDPEALPNYHYRDDALPVWNAINKYARKIVNLFYESDKMVQNDPELRQWAQEMVAPYPDGIGLKGVPGDGKFETRDQLIRVITSIIFTCSASHAAVNFSQYDEYSFLPNYPGSLIGTPPTDKEPRTEADIMKCVPSKEVLLDTILVVKILSTRGTKNLGDFEVKYLHTPEASKAAQEMVDELAKISVTNKEKNKTRDFIYDVLDPEIIPNSISI